MSNKKWANNELQFARLIAEIEAAGGFTATLMDDLCKSMDLSNIEISELVGRAQKHWDDAKDMPTLEELHADGQLINEWPAGRNNEDSEQEWDWNNRVFIVYVSSGAGEVAPGATISEKIDEDDEG